MTLARRISFVVAVSLVVTMAPTSFGVAQGLEHGQRIGSHRDLRRACEEARIPGRRLLYEVTAPRFRFGAYDEDTGHLPIDFGRNLRVLGGVAELHPAGLREVGFLATPDLARELTDARAQVQLRLGFFLGFDGNGQSCIVRSAYGTSLLRADVAYLELVDAEGRVIARQDTELLRSWRDDAASQVAVVVGEPRLERGRTELSSLRAAVEARAPAMLGCLDDAHRRGAPATAEMVLRFDSMDDGRTQASVALSSIGESEGTECVRAAVAGVSLAERATVLLPVTLTVQRALPTRDVR